MRATCLLILMLAVVSLPALAVPIQGEQQPTILYNPLRNDYLVVFSVFGSETPKMKARVLNFAGEPVAGSDFTIKSEPSNDFRGSPALALDLDHDRIYVAWTTWDGTDSPIHYAVIDARTYQLVNNNIITTFPQNIEDAGVAYAPTIGKFLVVWPDRGNTVQGMYFDHHGDVQSAIFTAATGSPTPLLSARVAWGPGPNSAGSTTGNFHIIAKVGAADQVYNGVTYAGSVANVAMAQNVTARNSWEAVAQPAQNRFIWPVIQGSNLDIFTVDPPANSANGTVAPAISADLAKSVTASLYRNTDDFVVVTQQTDYQLTVVDYDNANLGAPEIDVLPAVQLTDVINSYTVAANDCHGALVVAATQAATNELTLNYLPHGPVCPPEIAVSPSSLTLPRVGLSAASSTPVTISVSRPSATIDVIEITGSSAFAVDSGGCLNRNLGPDDVCTFTVRLLPQTSGGTFSGSLRIGYDGFEEVVPVTAVVDGAANVGGGTNNLFKIDLVTPTQNAVNLDPANAVLIWQAPPTPPTKLTYRTSICQSSNRTNCVVNTTHILGK